MIKFNRKEFSFGSGAYKGALIGASAGTFLGGLTPKTLPRFKSSNNKLNKFIDKYNDLKDIKVIEDKDPKSKKPKEVITSTSANQRLAMLGVSTAVGAVLGAIIGGVKDLSTKASRLTVDNRLMSSVVSKLKSKSYKEDLDFTRDPKEANYMKTKVCIVISRNAGEFKVLVNVVDDPKLKYKSDKIIRSLSGKFQVRNNSVSNRYNEINISTVSNISSNVNTTVEIVSGFIEAGYPVYLVEVG